MRYAHGLVPIHLASAIGISLSLGGLALAEGLDEQVDQYVHAQMEQSHTPGTSVGIVRGGKAILAKGYGLANVELRTPATAATVYEVLSVTKQFTAAAILLLVDDGKLSFDDPISRHLPDSPSAWTPITIRHLLAHTSGIPDYTDIRPFFEQLRQDASPDELLQPVRERPLDFAPGARWRYSNSNYYVLGLVVERISGMKYADFLRDRIFGPLAMDVSRVNDMTSVIPGRAAGYHWLGDDADKLPAIVTGYHGTKNVLQNAIYVSPTRKWAAGAVVSSVQDLVKWEQAIQSGKLLTARSWELMRTAGRTKDGAETSYGLGTELWTRRGRHLAGHQGGGIAFNATFLRCSEADAAVIVLCNQSSGPSRKMAFKILSMVVPELSYHGSPALEDPNPETAKLLARVLREAHQGKADPALFASDASRSARFIRRAGPSFLGPLGELQKVELLEQRADGNNRVLTYRSIFTSGTSIWNLSVNKNGKILNLQPVEE